MWLRDFSAGSSADFGIWFESDKKRKKHTRSPHQESALISIFVKSRSVHVMRDWTLSWRYRTIVRHNLLRVQQYKTSIHHILTYFQFSSRSELDVGWTYARAAVFLFVSFIHGGIKTKDFDLLKRAMCSRLKYIVSSSLFHNLSFSSGYFRGSDKTRPKAKAVYWR